MGGIRRARNLLLVPKFYGMAHPRLGLQVHERMPVCLLNNRMAGQSGPLTSLSSGYS